VKKFIFLKTRWKRSIWNIY